MAKKTGPATIVLMTAACTDDMRYHDGGSALIVGTDISAERAKAMLDMGTAVVLEDSADPAPAPAEDAPADLLAAD